MSRHATENTDSECPAHQRVGVISIFGRGVLAIIQRPLFPQVISRTSSSLLDESWAQEDSSWRIRHLRLRLLLPRGNSDAAPAPLGPQQQQHSALSTVGGGPELSFTRRGWDWSQTPRPVCSSKEHTCFKVSCVAGQWSMLCVGVNRRRFG